MARSTTPDARKQLQRFLRRYPDTQMLELLVPDIAGVLRGKRIRRREFEKALTQGFVMPGGTVLLDTLGNTVPGIRYTAGDGDPDLPAIVLSETLAPIPWSRKPAGQALFRFLDEDGSPFFADPRSVLERCLQPFRKRRQRVVAAVELEFYLLADRTDVPTPRVARVPGIGRPQPGPQVYTSDDLDDVEAFLDELHAVCEEQGIPAGTTTSEFAPGQFEINLDHVDDPVAACDHAVLLKRAVKAVARRHGCVACFMAKPFEDDAGSGLHVHLSIVDRNGRNYFSHGRESLAGPPYSARLRYAVGGLQKTMAEAMAVFAPNVNSYRRLRPEMFAPVEPNWGSNHRNVALRIPVSDANNLRIEHRTAGADANPYLVMAAILAGIDCGLVNKQEPTRMIAAGEEVTLKRRLPARWDAALDRFARSKVLPNYFGEEYCRSYLANRRDEARRFHNIVSPADYDWYLRAV